MLKYVIRRILLFIPTLIIISILAFLISVWAPGDPVEKLMPATSTEDVTGRNALTQQQRNEWTHRLGLDLPVFYFSLTSLSVPDTLYKITDRNERAAVLSLIYRYGNTAAIMQYHSQIKHLHEAQQKVIIDSSSTKNLSANEIHDVLIQSRFTTLSLLSASDPNVIGSKLTQLNALYGQHPFFSNCENLLQQVKEKYYEMITAPECWKNFIPVFHFYADNQYKRWLFGDGNWLTGKGSVYSKGIVRGDLGISYVTFRPVSEEICDHIGWSLFFTFISILIAYLISIPIGIRAAANHGSRFDRFSAVILFVLHSLPVFWVATLLLMTFANVDLLNWFPSSGVKPVAGYPDQASFFEKARITFPYLILPIIAYTYSSLAYLSRIMRVSMLEVLHKDYIRTAYAKGLSQRTVIYKHALRNAWLPMITVFANVFPAAIGGSVILETIFTIPGMGLEIYQAIQTQNYPVIVGVFTITGLMTLVGYLIADILYAAVDPRVSLSLQV